MNLQKKRIRGKEPCSVQKRKRLPCPSLLLGQSRNWNINHALIRANVRFLCIVGKYPTVLVLSLENERRDKHGLICTSLDVEMTHDWKDNHLTI